MELKFNEKEFTNAKDVICGFTTPNNTKGETDTHFNLIASPDLQFNTAMQLIQSITVNLLSVFIEQHPEAKHHVYDAYNMMASSILDVIIPSSELPLTLEEEALLTAEKTLIEERYESLSQEEKDMYTSRLNTIKERLLQKPQTKDEASAL